MASIPSFRRRAATGRRLAIGTALALCAALPLAGSAHASTTTLVPAGSGLTIPAGVVGTPDGATWVSDQNMGVCRVRTSAPAELVQSPYCQPPAVDPAPTTRQGPTTPFQVVFDDGSSNFFVAEGSSHGAGVWRMHWNAATGAIDRAAPIVAAGRNRVFALALGHAADGSVYIDFNGRDDTLIHRLSNAAGVVATALIDSTPVVGTAGTPGIVSMANLDGSLYLAELGGVTRILSPGAGAPAAQSVPGFPAAGAVPHALAADTARGRVYAGTANPSGGDRVDVLTPADGVVSTYERGFAFVTGMGVRSDGALLVGDDPAASAGGIEPLGASRLFTAALHDTNPPVATITAGPAAYTNATSVRFEYSSTPAASFGCRLDGADFADCGSAPSASQDYTGLTDGIHVFEVKAGAGDPTRQTFVVDTRPPVATITNPASDHAIATGSLRMRFAADEFGVSWTCMLDGQALTRCNAPFDLSGLAVGDHTFSVTPTDVARNVGETQSWTFTRTSPPAPADSSASSTPTSTAGGSSDASPATPATPAPAASAAAAAASCRPLGRGGTGRYSVNAGGRGRILTARIQPPAGARYAKLILRPSGARGAAQTIAVRTLAGSGARTVRVVLSLVQASLLRARRVTVVVGYGTCAGTIGATAPLKRR